MSHIKAITDLLNKGTDILYTAKLFGGISNLLKLSKPSPYLTALIQSKLGGTLHCSALNDDEVMSAFNLDFVIIELEEVDMDDLNHYNASVDVIIPELTEGKEMQILSTWLDDYLLDMGAEVGSFNDSNLNKKMIWIYVKKINGKTFINLENGANDKEVLQVIPSQYFV